MRTKKGLIMRTLGNEFILVDEGSNLTDFNRMISLNASAALLWEAVQDKEFDAAALVDILLDNYDITREVAEHGIDALILNWREAGILEE